MKVFKKCALIVAVLLVIFCAPLSSFAVSVPSTPMLGEFKIYKSEMVRSGGAATYQVNYTVSGYNNDGTPIWESHASDPYVSICDQNIIGENFAGVSFRFPNPSNTDTYGYRMTELIYDIDKLSSITKNSNDYYFDFTLACVYRYGADGVGSNLVSSCSAFPVYANSDGTLRQSDTAISVTVNPKRVIKTYNGNAYEKDYCDFMGEDLVACFSNRIPDGCHLSGIAFLWNFGSALLEMYAPADTTFYVSEITSWQYQPVSNTDQAINNMSTDVQQAINDANDKLLNADFEHADLNSDVASSGIEHGGGLLNDIGTGLSGSSQLFGDGMAYIRDIYSHVQPIVSTIWSTLPAPVIGLVIGAIVFLILRKVVGR